MSVCLSVCVCMYVVVLNEPALFVLREQYVEVYIDYYLNKSVKKQFEAFSVGFHRVCGGKVLVSVHCTINCDLLPFRCAEI